MTSNEILEQGLLNVKFEVTMVIAQHLWHWKMKNTPSVVPFHNGYIPFHNGYLSVDRIRPMLVGTNWELSIPVKTPIVKQQEDMPPFVNEMINDNFWDLIYR